MNAKRDVAKEIGIGHARCLQRGKPVPVNAKITRNSPNFQEEFVTPV
jgi:glucosamine 6-phosphate synthetase-like amidotransferase/phosphosugar isomerase protein